MKPETIKRSLYAAFVISSFLLSLQLFSNGIKNSDWHDFDVFYSASRAALEGKSIYIIVGEYNLPFWYFPWTAWLFIPFAIWPHNIALILYQSISVLSAIASVHFLTSYYNRNFEFLDKLLILALMIPMSLLVMIVGQMEYLLLGLILITMYAIDQKRYLLAGLLFPFLWTKPHLLIVFTLIAFWRGGKLIIMTSLISSVLMLAVQTIISPGWHLEMMALLQAGQRRVDGLEFTTFPSLLGYQENWVGTANLSFTVILIILALLIVWKFRSLAPIPLLSLALTASIFCAPRAYAYDLPLLIPGLIWFTAKEFKTKAWIWIVSGIFPLLVGYSTSAYLITLFIFILGIWKAHNDTQQDANISHLFGTK